MKTISLLVTVLSFIPCVAQTKDPSLKDTLEWMHNAFPESSSLTATMAGQTRELNSSNCTVTITDRWKDKATKKLIRRDTVIDLSLIDPDSIKAYVENMIPGDKDIGDLMLVTTDDKKNIVEKTGGKSYYQEREFITFIGIDYAERFAKAFKHAVMLCGGKSSTF
jgi:hypothetical protein